MNYKCYECGTTECIQHHHVVPRSVGGTKTIPLCSICHGKVHGIKRDKQINISELTKAGILEARKAGKRLGNPNPASSLAKGQATIKRTADEFALGLEKMVMPLRFQSGYTLKEIADVLNNAEVKTRRNGSWDPKRVSMLIKRINNLEDK